MTLSHRICLHGGVPSTPRRLPDGNISEIKVSPGAGWRKRRIMCHVVKIRFILNLTILEGILSSSTNFLIYCFIGHNFRKEFFLLLGLRRKMVRNFSKAILIKSFFYNTKGETEWVVCAVVDNACALGVTR